MRIGVDYYPEHWDKALWQQDADLMRETGVELVRLAEFAWCRLEPREGVFDFSWLDEAVEVFASRGIGVVLCTPTCTPPLWLYEKYPEAIQTGSDGRRIAIGVRGHRDMNNPVFLTFVDRIVEEMTRHYAGNPAVIAWQIDNELERNTCFCEVCTGKFRAWMQEKYGTLENLNRAYGNIVWSGEYSDWSQVKPPFGQYLAARYNPSLMLDFYRFTSRSAIDFNNRQARIIRRNCPGLPVTTNTWFLDNMPDFYELFQDMDFVAADNYPTTQIPSDPETCYTHAFHMDVMRGVKRAPFWVMEELAGCMGCWLPMTRMPEPGMIKGYALQAFAHGADTMVMFRWRTATTGAEMHWHGLIDHSNVPGRRFEEFADLCRTAREIKHIQGAKNKADVAILFSFESDHAFKVQPQTNDYYYFEQLQRLHLAFMSCGLNVDIIGQHEPLEGYRIVCAPEMYVTNETTVRHLHDFAAKGGTVILTTRSGVKDKNNNCIMAPLPTVYRDMAGAYVTEYNPIGGDTVEVRFADGTLCRGKQWCDVMQAETAEVIASYASEYFAGSPAILRNTYGQGTVYYIATVGQQELYDHLIRSVVESAGVPFAEGLPPQVELTTRTGKDAEYRFIFNNANRYQRFRLTGEEIALAPFEMKITSHGKNIS